MYKLIGVIVEVRGECSAGHRVGEKFDLTVLDSEGRALRAPRVCSFFYDVLFPYILTLQFGGRFPWQEGETLIVSCPDNCKVKMRIERVKVE